MNPSTPSVDPPTPGGEAAEMASPGLLRAVLAADVLGALTSARTIADALQGCCEAIVAHVGAAFARVWTLNEFDRVLELQASAGLYTHLDGAHNRVPVGRFKIGLIAEERQPHLTNDVAHAPGSATATGPRPKGWCRSPGIRCWSTVAWSAWWRSSPAID